LDEIDNSTTPPGPASGRSPAAAAALSFVWPGLGQLYRGRRRLALLFGIPPILAALLLLYALRRGALVLAVQLFADRTVGLAAIALVVLMGVWRLASVAHAYLTGQGGRGRLQDRIVVTAVVAIIVASHLGVGMTLAFVSNTGTTVFSGGPDLADASTPTPSGSPVPGASPLTTDAGPTASPTAAPSLDSRVTILFLGGDSSAGRSGTRYDTIMVVSYDPKTNSVQMVSVPRDSVGFPLYSGGQVSISTRINGLSRDTLVKEVGYLVGIPINFWATIDFIGFRNVITAVGGIDIVNSSVINDPSYDWLNNLPAGFYLGTGPQHLDGDHALAYARSRHGSSDWSRAGRQQQVVVALLHQMAKFAQADPLSLPGLITTLANSVKTNFPSDQVADYIDVGQRALPTAVIRQVVLGPPYSVGSGDTRASTTCLVMPYVAGLSIQLFGKDSTWYRKATPGNTCVSAATPAPTATPAPSTGPTPEPTAAPTASTAPAVETPTPPAPPAT